MRTERPPFWFWPLDRWKLLLALGLALAFLAGLRGCNAPARIAAPVITSPAAGAQLRTGALGDVAGTAAPRAAVHVFEGERLLANTTADTSGKWRFPMPALAAGEHVLTARMVGPDGKLLAASRAVRFTVAETVGGAPVIVGPAAGAPPALSGTGLPGSLVKVFEGDKLLGESAVGADGKWTLALPALAAGAHDLVARTYGADGKELAASQPFSVTPAEERAGSARVPGSGRGNAGDRLAARGAHGKRFAAAPHRPGRTRFGGASVRRRHAVGRNRGRCGWELGVPAAGAVGVRPASRDDRGRGPGRAGCTDFAAPDFHDDGRSGRSCGPARLGGFRAGLHPARG